MRVQALRWKWSRANEPKWQNVGRCHSTVVCGAIVAGLAVVIISEFTNKNSMTDKNSRTWNRCTLKTHKNLFFAIFLLQFTRLRCNYHLFALDTMLFRFSRFPDFCLPSEICVFCYLPLTKLGHSLLARSFGSVIAPPDRAFYSRCRFASAF